MRDCWNFLKLTGVQTKVYEYFAIWSIWPQLPYFYKLYWLLLSLVSLYTLFSAVSIVRRFSISNRKDDSPASSRIRLEAGITNLRQVVAAMFFTFGALLFSALPGAFQTFGLRRSLPLNDIMGAFSLHFAFAANVFFVLLLLHCGQWLVSRRVLSAK
jgi:hypothetical protein